MVSFDKLWEKYGDKSTKMQYPYDSSGTNRLFDGTVHKIIPREIKPLKLNGRDFSVMRYYDINMETELVTLLTKIGNTLAKVPLDDYNILFKYLKANNIMSNDNSTSIVLPDIQLAQTMNAQDLLMSGSHKKPIFKFNEYVPLSENGTVKSIGGSFSSSLLIIEPYTDIETYMFSKAGSFADKDQEIQNGIRNLPSNKIGIYKYKFSIDVREGSMASILSVDNENKVRHQLVLLIPGIHEYTITYAPCMYREDYIASRYASTMLIKATWPEYLDRHNRDIAFYDGCRRKLSIEFYNANGKKLDDGEKKHMQRRW